MSPCLEDHCPTLWQRVGVSIQSYKGAVKAKWARVSLPLPVTQAPGDLGEIQVGVALLYYHLVVSNIDASS